MKNLFVIVLFSMILFACGNSKKGQAPVAEQSQQALVLSVDELYANAAEMVDKEVVVKGTVMHVCKQGGGRCFIMGSNEDINIRVEAGEKIGAFDQEQMGSDLEITGIFKVVKTEADAHNPAKEHGEGEQHSHSEDAETADVHNVIAQSQENAEVVYFIEGLSVKEVKEL